MDISHAVIRIAVVAAVKTSSYMCICLLWNVWKNRNGSINSFVWRVPLYPTTEAGETLSCAYSWRVHQHVTLCATEMFSQGAPEEGFSRADRQTGQWGHHSLEALCSYERLDEVQYQLYSPIPNALCIWLANFAHIYIWLISLLSCVAYCASKSGN